MPSRLAAVVLSLVVLVLPACSGDDPSPVSAPGTPSSATTSAPPSAGPSASASASVVPEPSTAPSFPGDTRPDTEDPAGGALTVTRVRVARQDGFDRVVYELAGAADGAPGWRVEYTDDPRSDGSGDPVDVDGAATLAVVITGVGLPFDTGVEESSDDPDLPGDLEVVEDVVLDAQFEGQFASFIGLSAEQAFTVRRLASPPRVVVDIAH